MTFLSVLGFLGRVFLVLLGFLLVSLFYLLLAPWRYRIKGAHTEESGWEGDISFDGFLSFWRIRFAKVSASYELRVFTFWGKLQVYPRKKKKDNEIKNTSENELPEDWSEEELSYVLEDAEVTREDVLRMQQERAEEGKDATTSETIAESSEDKNAPSEGEDQTKHKDKGKKKQKCKKKRRSSKTKKNNGRMSFFEKIRDPRNQDAVFYMLRKAMHLLKKIRPRILEANVTYSGGDPAVTGYLTGALSLCKFSYDKKCSLNPDFSSEEPYLWGDFSVKGIVILWDIVYLVISVLLHKNCRRLFGWGDA